MIKRRTFLVGTVGVVSGIASGLSTPAVANATGLATLSGESMGTYYRILFPDDAGTVGSLQLNALGTLAEVDRLMSTYQPDSELSKFNSADMNSPVTVSDHTRKVIEEARRVNNLTSGAFDATIGPLVELWGFGASGRRPAPPTTVEISQTARRLGMDALMLEGPEIWKTRPQLAVDLSGIAKGYAVDQLSEMLDARGVQSYLVDLGGELRAKGYRPEGRPWRVGIERPERSQRAVHRIVELNDRAIATSGDYRNFIRQGGQIFSHVIDPRIGRPVVHSLTSVTVIAQNAMTADALSTALMVMGPDEGPAFAQRQGIAAYFVIRDGNRLIDHSTATFKPFVMDTA